MVEGNLKETKRTPHYVQSYFCLFGGSPEKNIAHTYIYNINVYIYNIIYINTLFDSGPQLWTITHVAGTFQ